MKTCKQGKNCGGGGRTPSYIITPQLMLVEVPQGGRA